MSPDGTKYAVLYGDRDKAGSVFSYAFWMPAGVWVGGHRHNQTAHVAVLEGELLLGFGRKMDRQKVVRVPRGGFFVVEAEEPHFEGCERDTLIVGTAMGGWRTTEFE
ncbi:hypothetical protein F183_A02610 [Bryobacterales bacterium F-183]|nr:hypothetical protein F183_A02610 [Bryobacterales bacterium F-183]